MHAWLDDIGLKMGDVWAWHDMPVLFTAHPAAVYRDYFNPDEHQWLVVWLGEHGNSRYTWLLAWMSSERYTKLRNREIDLHAVFADPEDDTGELLIVKVIPEHKAQELYLPAELLASSFPKAGEYLPQRPIEFKV